MGSRYGNAQEIGEESLQYINIIQIYIPLPDLEARIGMVKSYLPTEMSEDLDYDHFGKELQNYSGSDIKLVCEEAAMKPLRRLLSQIDELQVEKLD